jgi:hypothetical protein
VYEDITEKKGYPLPHPDNYLEDDVDRLRTSLTAIDGDIDQLEGNVNQLAENETQLEETLETEIGRIETALAAKADLEEGIVPLEQLPVSKLGKLDVVPEGFGDNTGKSGQTMPASDKEFILVPGLGIFRYDEDSEAPVDGETCIAPASSPGRWLLVVPDVNHVLTWIHDEAAFAAHQLQEMSFPTILTASANLDFPSIAAQSSAALTIAVAGAVFGNIVTATPPTLTAGLFYVAYVSENNKVTVRMTNITGSAINPATGQWTVKVIKS